MFAVLWYFSMCILSPHPPNKGMSFFDPPPPLKKVGFKWGEGGGSRRVPTKNH